MSYWQLYYHFVWAMHRQSSLTEDAALPVRLTTINDLVRTRAQRLGATVFAVGGTATHIHLVASVPPRLALSTFVGQVKSGVSRHINHHGLLPHHFHWQETYGAVSVERQHLPHLVTYVDHQARLHAEGKTIAMLETVEGDTQEVLAVTQDYFAIDSDVWRAELLALDAQLFT
ncbi:MAG: transposase [Caldilineaceae bacterium]|nr:transposase [Caldilineaceae bacterium]